MTAKGPEKNLAEMTEPHIQKSFQVFILQLGNQEVLVDRGNPIDVRAFFRHRLK
jgi:hypothetical protein